MNAVLRDHPYRLFFPLGILFGVVGVGEWFLWSVGRTSAAVSFLHAALQAQGFLACFVVGFLMTAFPRFAGAAPAALWEVFAAALAAVAFLGLSLAGQWAAAEGSFLAMIAVLLVFAARRMPARTKPLPAPFLLMGFGFLHALLGPSLILASGFGAENPALLGVGRQMVQLGFLLCMVMAVSAQLTPFLLGHPGVERPDRAAPAKAGPLAVAIHGAAGVAIVASFFVDAAHLQAGALIRAVTVSAHLLFFAGIARRPAKTTATALFFWISLWMIPVGLWMAALLSLRVAALHVVFIAGFSLMIFAFGQLIVLSHTGHAALLNGRLVPLKIVGAAALLAATARVSADFFPAVYVGLIRSASVLWVLAAALWLGWLLPKMAARR